MYEGVHSSRIFPPVEKQDSRMNSQHLELQMISQGLVTKFRTTELTSLTMQVETIHTSVDINVKYSDNHKISIV